MLSSITCNTYVSPYNNAQIHLDLSSAYRSGGLGHVGSDYTGAGARLAVEIIRRTLGMGG